MVAIGGIPQYVSSSTVNSQVTVKRIAAGHYIATADTDSSQRWTIVRDDDDLIGLPWMIFEGEYTHREDTDRVAIWTSGETLKEAKMICSRNVLAVIDEDTEIRTLSNRAPKDAHVVATLDFVGSNDPQHGQGEPDTVGDMLAEIRELLQPTPDNTPEYDYFAALKELRRLTGAGEWAAERTLLFAFDKPSAGTTLAGVHVRFHKNGTTGRMWYTITPVS
jgi:hypothetical protein